MNSLAFTFAVKLGLGTDCLVWSSEGTAVSMFNFRFNEFDVIIIIVISYNLRTDQIDTCRYENSFQIVSRSYIFFFFSLICLFSTTNRKCSCPAFAFSRLLPYSCIIHLIILALFSLPRAKKGLLRMNAHDTPLVL